jgi:hypothetical protein
MSNRFASVNRYILEPTKPRIRCNPPEARNSLTNHAVFCLTNPGRDWPPEGGPCEILPVGAALASARPHPVPAVRDSDLNYSQVAGEQKLTQEEQEPKSVS